MEQKPVTILRGADGQKKLGREDFNEKQGKIIAVYHEEIDAALKEAGGDKLAYKWAGGEYLGSRAWLYSPALGDLNYLQQVQQFSGAPAHRL